MSNNCCEQAILIPNSTSIYKCRKCNRQFSVVNNKRFYISEKTQRVVRNTKQLSNSFNEMHLSDEEDENVVFTYEEANQNRHYNSDDDYTESDTESDSDAAIIVDDDSVISESDSCYSDSEDLDSEE